MLKTKMGIIELPLGSVECSNIKGLREEMEIVLDAIRHPKIHLESVS